MPRVTETMAFIEFRMDLYYLVECSQRCLLLASKHQEFSSMAKYVSKHA